jgi:two-component system response regulator FixJ
MMSATEPSLICVVDDDDAVRHLTENILRSHGFRVRSYATADAFLAEFDESATACIVSDLRMPEVDGEQLQRRLKERGSIVSIVVLSGYADVRTTVRLMEDGIATLLEKPYAPDELTAAVERAVAQTLDRRKKQGAVRAAQLRLDRLTDEERDVLECIVAGLPNKAIAMKLGLSMRTLDRRRQTVLAKMDVSSPAELATVVSRFKAGHE